MHLWPSQEQLSGNICPDNINSGNMGPGNIDPGNICPGNIGLGNIGPRNIVRGNMCPGDKFLPESRKHSILPTSLIRKW